MRKVFVTQNVYKSVLTEHSSHPARYLNLFCASEEEIIQGQVKVSLYSGVLRLHHSWLQASKLKWSIICIEVLQKKNNNNYSWCSKYEI